MRLLPEIRFCWFHAPGPPIPPGAQCTPKGARLACNRDLVTVAFSFAFSLAFCVFFLLLSPSFPPLFWTGMPQMAPRPSFHRSPSFFFEICILGAHPGLDPNLAPLSEPLGQHPRLSGHFLLSLYSLPQAEALLPMRRLRSAREPPVAVSTPRHHHQFPPFPSLLPLSILPFPIWATYLAFPCPLPLLFLFRVDFIGLLFNLSSVNPRPSVRVHPRLSRTFLLPSCSLPQHGALQVKTLRGSTFLPSSGRFVTAAS